MVVHELEWLVSAGTIESRSQYPVGKGSSEYPDPFMPFALGPVGPVQKVRLQRKNRSIFFIRPPFLF